jgi:hypothetical protein
MRAPILPIATLAVALLSACGSPTVTAENASMKEVAQKLKESGIADEKFIEPGHWQMTMTINDMTMPGAPPGMAERMKGAIYSGDAYRMNIKSSGEGGPDNPMAGMTMTATMDAKRTGVCTGKEPG